MDVHKILAERDETLNYAAQKAIAFLNKAQTRDIEPTKEALKNLSLLDGPFPETPMPSKKVIEELEDIGSEGAMVTISPRFFGFVTGANLPVTVAAQWLAAAWDQLPNMAVLSPLACKLEQVAEKWLVDVLHLPKQARCSFVTGTTTADMVCLLGARNHVLEQYGWDIQTNGVFGAPKIRVLVGEEVHTTMLRALRAIGIGNAQIEKIPVNDNGAIDANKLPEFRDEPTIVCLQAGNVDSGAFDPFDTIIEKAKKYNAWVHIDGAFGLWAASNPKLKYLMKGFEKADSWATDAHKWLNVPYDSGMAFYKDEMVIKKALTLKGNYLVQGNDDPMNRTLETSRRARGTEIWAALKSLGRKGVSDMIGKSCDLAKYFEKRLKEEGFEILNNVELNQVMVSFGSDEKTKAVIKAIQKEGTAWFGGTNWHGKEAMRISTVGWSTTKKDIDMSMEALLKVVNQFN